MSSLEYVEYHDLTPQKHPDDHFDTVAILASLGAFTVRGA
jgi:hypothetical protein